MFIPVTPRSNMEGRFAATHAAGLSADDRAFRQGIFALTVIPHMTLSACLQRNDHAVISA